MRFWTKDRLWTILDRVVAGVITSAITLLILKLLGH